MPDTPFSAPTSLAEQMLYSTAKVTALGRGEPIGEGTGFYWSVMREPPSQMLLLVTNKHVIEGADSIAVLTHLTPNVETPQPSGEFANCVVELSATGVFPHPDLTVDLVGINISGLMREAQAGGRDLYVRGMAARFLPTADEWQKFDAVENVIMIGCPRGIFDQVNNLPITRRGITATPLFRRYEGRDEFLVDMACFPGSSGSPVFMVDQNGFVDRATNRYRMGEGRFFFLGILYAGPTITNEGTIILGGQPRIEVAGMMHLGQCIRSTKMLEIEELALRAVEGVQTSLPS